MSSEEQAIFLSLHFLHQAYYLIAFFSARGHSEAGLKLGDGVLEVTRHLLEFLFIHQRAHACGLFAPTSFRLLQKKNKKDF